MENAFYTQNIIGHNPLSDIISDDVYNLLISNGLLNEVSIRDRMMRMKFRTLRDNKISTSAAIELLQEEYPYLQYETIKKIVHHPRKAARTS
ncbi:MAG: hypothetical protein Q8903_06010 [Bacteroidota bacterium]|nr:hypothetical protein [Bacteroidota bacterium]